jgi:hypothetical protein
MLNRPTLSVAILLLTATATAQPAPAPAPPPAEPAPPPIEPAPPPPAEAAPAPAPEPAPAPPPPAPPETAAAPAGAPVAEPEVEPAPPAALAVGKEKNGLFNPGLLIQAWFFLQHQKGREEPYVTSFRIRRAELKVKGEIVPDLVAYQIMIDPAKLLRFTTEDVEVDNQDPPPTDPAAPETVAVPQPPADTSILQDAYVTFLSEYADLSIGQFKNLVSWEGYNSASKIILPERSAVSRRFGDRRDLGIKVEKTFEPAGYAFGVFNGQGLNQLDGNNQKDFVLRGELYPIKGITVGLLGYVAVGERDEPLTKDRVEGDVRLELGDALFQSEYIRGWDVDDTGTRIQGHGAYGAIGYTFLDRVQPIVRIGFVDPDVEVSSDYEIGYEAGVNYFIQKHEAKLQLAYGLFDSADSTVENRNELTFNAQVSF